MKTIKQLLRQPLKTLSGIVLMTLAVAILCVSVGQALAVRTTQETLNQQFSTVAIPKGYELASGTVPQVDEQLLSWLEQTAQENPDIIQSVAKNGILSAYIPELTPLNITTEKYMVHNTNENYEFRYYEPGPINRPYCCAMLVITLDAVSEPEEQELVLPVENRGVSDFFSMEAWAQWYVSAEKKTATTGYTVELTGTVTQVVSLQEGYRDPVGRIARLRVSRPTLEEIQSLNLVPGEQYIVYGMDYTDEFWKLLGVLNQSGKYDFAQLEPFDPSRFYILNESDLEKNRHYYALSGNEELLAIRARYKGIGLDEQELWQLNAISMTLNTPVSQLQYEEVRYPDGRLWQLKPKDTVTCTTLDGEEITVDRDTYNQLYQIPTIARLDGTVEEFLQSDQGALWQSALERDAINNHAFAVIGVDDLDHLADFSLQKTKVVDGREFTKDELSTGARVCIIHEELALANGLQVGDTITPGFYTYDAALPYHCVDLAGEDVNPAASFWFDTTPFTETASYTIVGICRGQDTWPDVAENAYSFSANTIYVPKQSVQTPMEYRNGIPFVTVVLENGQIEQFHKLTMRSGYAGYFKFNDQGYSKIAENFHNYHSLATNVLLIGIVIFAVFLALFLMLYPGAQRKNVQTMESLGAKRSQRFGSVLLSCLCVLIPASGAGGLLGVLLWDRVTDILKEFAGAAMSVQLDTKALWMVAAAQIPLSVILCIAVAVAVTRPSRKSARR